MSTKETIEQPFTISKLTPTFNFRWLVKKSDERILQQLFIDPRFPPRALEAMGGYEWRDVPEKIEE